jgi:4'-phosphopantetheinyl transferase EntD
MKQTEIRELTCSVERAVNGAIADARGTLRLGENVGLAAVSEKDLPNYAPHPEEARILGPRASERRRVEFALGRAAGHLALKQLGSENTEPILRGQGGEPLWREGIAGSITHCFPWSAAIVVKCSNQFVIGVDLETVEGVQGTDITDLVCCEAELDWVRRGDFQERLTMIFSAKEAVYKAFYPVCLRFIDFKEIELTWFHEHSCFQAEFTERLKTDLLCGEVCAVYCRRHAEMVFSCVIHPLH